MEKQLNKNYENLLLILPKPQKKLLKKSHRYWLQYSESHSRLHRSIYNGDIEQCQIQLMFEYNAYLRLLLPQKNELITHTNLYIQNNIANFYADLNLPSNQNPYTIQLNLNSIFHQLNAKLSPTDSLNMKKTAKMWTYYRDQTCALMSERNIIPLKACLSQLSLDLTHHFYHYLKH